MTPVFANILQPLIDFFASVLRFGHDDIGFGWGFAIVAMTVLIRVALLPLTLRQFKSMRKLSRLQPEIRRIKEENKGNSDATNEAIMAMYKENKVNPFASCLPLVAQIPILLSLFYVLQDDLRRDICPDRNPPGADPQPCGDIDVSQFLFIPDITDRATGGVLIALLVIYVAAQLIAARLMADTMEPSQRKVMYVLPFFFITFLWQFPAGLLIYWTTTTLLSIAELPLKRVVDPGDTPSAPSGVPAPAE
jgi:YidC/Oxa1 family membrane protein insertase